MGVNSEKDKRRNVVLVEELKRHLNNERIINGMYKKIIPKVKRPPNRPLTDGKQRA